MVTQTLNGKTYNFYGLRGTVIRNQKLSQTHVYGGGGGQAGGYVSINSYNTIHDYIYVKDANGHEHEIRMLNWDIGTREGHELLFIRAIQKGYKTGPYLRVENMSTGIIHTDKKEMKKMCRYSLGFINLLITLPLTFFYILLWLQLDSLNISGCYLVMFLVVLAIGIGVSSTTHNSEYKRKVYKEIDTIFRKIRADIIDADIKSEHEIENKPKRNNPMEEIEKLFQMKEKGIITDEDFKTMKEKIIKSN